VLTNGVDYAICQSSVKAKAPDKLRYTVSINPSADTPETVRAVAESLSWLSRDARKDRALERKSVDGSLSRKVEAATGQSIESYPEVTGSAEET